MHVCISTLASPYESRKRWGGCGTFLPVWYHFGSPRFITAWQSLTGTQPPLRGKPPPQLPGLLPGSASPQLHIPLHFCIFSVRPGCATYLKSFFLLALQREGWHVYLKILGTDQWPVSRGGNWKSQEMRGIVTACWTRMILCHLDQPASIWQRWNWLHPLDHTQLWIFTDPYAWTPFTTRFVYLSAVTGQDTSSGWSQTLSFNNKTPMLPHAMKIIQLIRRPQHHALHIKPSQARDGEKRLLDFENNLVLQSSFCFNLPQLLNNSSCIRKICPYLSEKPNIHISILLQLTCDLFSLFPVTGSIFWSYKRGQYLIIRALKQGRLKFCF